MAFKHNNYRVEHQHFMMLSHQQNQMNKNSIYDNNIRDKAIINKNNLNNVIHQRGPDREEEELIKNNFRSKCLTR